jgi:endonuclease IV/intein/homing endonuclease
MPAVPMIGLHVSIADSMDLAFDRAKEAGATTFQIFTRNPNQWKFKPIPNEIAALFREKRRSSGIPRIVDHMPYLPNLASPDKAIMKISRYTLDEEIKRCDALGIDYLVIHLGSHLGKGAAVGIANIAGACMEALGESTGKTSILLENMAGQKNCVGARFEELGAILEKVGMEERMGVCIDTCLPPGSLVMSGGVPRSIEGVSVGEEVTGIGGEPTRVTRLIRRPYSGELVWVKPKGLPSLMLTPEHPLLCVKVDRIRQLDESPWRVKLTGDPGWIAAGEVKKGTYLVMPKLKSTTVLNLDFRGYAGAHSHRPFPMSLPLTIDLAEFFGLYLAEGYVFIGKGKGKRGGDLDKIYLCFGKHEHDLIVRTIRLFENIFSLKAWTDEEGPVVKVCAASNILARFLRSNFGPRAREKRIPPFIMSARDSIVRSFILAYRKGDGCVDETGIRFVTSSSIVATQLIHLLAGIDVHGTVSRHRPTESMIGERVVKGSGWYTVRVGRAEARKLGFDYHHPTIPQRTFLRNGDALLIPIGAVLKNHYGGEVVNLTTESGSFLAPFVVTHNCHAFAAGFDLTNSEAVNATMKLFDDLVGYRRLKVVHLNDSKGGLGSRLDRHENVGEGRIGKKGMKALLHYPGIKERPVIMETPYEDVKGMRQSIKAVRSLLK